LFPAACKKINTFLRSHNGRGNVTCLRNLFLLGAVQKRDEENRTLGEKNKAAEDKAAGIVHFIVRQETSRKRVNRELTAQRMRNNEMEVCDPFKFFSESKSDS
jgi:hypothetical protein